MLMWDFFFAHVCKAVEAAEATPSGTVIPTKIGPLQLCHLGLEGKAASSAFWQKDFLAKQGAGTSRVSTADLPCSQSPLTLPRLCCVSAGLPSAGAVVTGDGVRSEALVKTLLCSCIRLVL